MKCKPEHQMARLLRARQDELDNLHAWLREIRQAKSDGMGAHSDYRSYCTYCACSTITTIRVLDIAIRDLKTIAQEKPLAKRVRIAVAMSDDGTFWSARGFSGLKDGKNQPDGFLREGAEMDMESEEISTYRTHMVEVDIPLPPEAPLQATLVGDSQ